MSIIDIAVWTRRGLITAVTAGAFWTSYGHTSKWFMSQGQKDHAGLLALMPEAGVVILVLSLVLPDMNRLAKWTIAAFGLISVGITFTANVSDAGAGLGGKAAALIAPVFALLGFMLEASSLVNAVSAPAGEIAETVPEPVPSAADELLAARRQMVQDAEAQGITVGINRDGSLSFAPPVVQSEPVQDEPVVQPVKAQRKPVSRSTGGLLDGGIIWATGLSAAGESWPTVAQIMAQFPEMSRSTAKRVRAASPAGTDGTAKIEESVNA